MYDAIDYIIATIFGCLVLGILLLCIAGSYAIIKETNNPAEYRKYEINGNTPTLITKGI